MFASSTRSARAIALDERHVRRAAAERLEPERARAGKRVEHARARRRVGPSTLNSVSRRPSDVGRTSASRRRLRAAGLSSRPAMMRTAVLPDARPGRSASAQFADRYSTSGRAPRRCVEPGDGLAPRVFHQRVVAQQVADAQRRQPGLPRAEEVARAAQREIALGDDEAVGRLDERVEPRARPRR